MRLRLAGRVGAGVFADVMRALDGAAKDIDKMPATKAPTQVVVEVAKFNGHHQEPAS